MTDPDPVDPVPEETWQITGQGCTLSEFGVHAQMSATKGDLSRHLYFRCGLIVNGTKATTMEMQPLLTCLEAHITQNIHEQFLYGECLVEIVTVLRELPFIMCKDFAFTYEGI